MLAAAFRADHEHHAPARAWLNTARPVARRGAPVVLLPVVATSFVRVVGQRRAFPVPTPPDEAVAFVEALLGFGEARITNVEGEWPIFVRLCRQHSPTRGGVTDVWIAAAVLRLGEHLVTFDGDFRRLLPPDHLTVLDPNAS